MAFLGARGIVALGEAKPGAQINLDARQLLHDPAPVVKGPRLPNQRAFFVFANGMRPIQLQGLLPRTQRQRCLQEWRVFCGLQMQRSPPIAAAPTQRAKAIHPAKGLIHQLAAFRRESDGKNGAFACLNGCVVFQRGCAPLVFDGAVAKVEIGSNRPALHFGVIHASKSRPVLPLQCAPAPIRKPQPDGALAGIGHIVFQPCVSQQPPFLLAHFGHVYREIAACRPSHTQPLPQQRLERRRSPLRVLPGIAHEGRCDERDLIATNEHGHP